MRRYLYLSCATALHHSAIAATSVDFKSFSAPHVSSHINMTLCHFLHKAQLITTCDLESARHLAFGARPRRHFVATPTSCLIRLMHLSYLQQALAMKLEPPSAVGTNQERTSRSTDCLPLGVAGQSLFPLQRVASQHTRATPMTDMRH